MSDTNSSLPNGCAAGRGEAGLSPKVFSVLAIAFSVVTVGALALVVVDWAIDRPALGDIFIAGLNGVLAAVLWTWSAQRP